MINDKTVLAVIPARGGSKGLPRKNITLIGDIPLIAYSIYHARNSNMIDKVICSTEDEEIANVAKKYDCEVPFMRSDLFASDTATTQEVIIDICEKLKRYDYIVVLQPTSPLRTSNDIDDCIKLCHERKASSVTTVCLVDKNPQWMFSIEEDLSMKPVLEEGFTSTRRQDLSEIYILNGAVYVLRWENMIKKMSFILPDSLAFIMPRERSIDIDTELDLKLAKLLLGDE